MLIRTKKAYSYNRKVISYFNFPQLAFAVTLCLGDLLLFDTTEPHAINTRCNKKLYFYCISFYLKSALVGLNNKSKSLTPFEERVVEHNNLQCNKNSTSQNLIDSFLLLWHVTCLMDLFCCTFVTFLCHWNLHCCINTAMVLNLSIVEPWLEIFLYLIHFLYAFKTNVICCNQHRIGLNIFQ